MRYVSLLSPAYVDLCNIIQIFVASEPLERHYHCMTWLPNICECSIGVNQKRCWASLVKCLIVMKGATASNLAIPFQKACTNDPTSCSKLLANHKSITDEITNSQLMARDTHFCTIPSRSIALTCEVHPGSYVHMYKVSVFQAS